MNFSIHDLANDKLSASLLNVLSIIFLRTSTLSTKRVEMALLMLFHTNSIGPGVGRVWWEVNEIYPKLIGLFFHAVRHVRAEVIEYHDNRFAIIINRSYLPKKVNEALYNPIAFDLIPVVFFICGLPKLQTLTVLAVYFEESSHLQTRLPFLFPSCILSFQTHSKSLPLDLSRSLRRYPVFYTHVDMALIVSHP